MWLPVRQNVFLWPHGKLIKNSCDVKIYAAQDCSQIFHVRFATHKQQYQWKLPYQETERTYAHTHIYLTHDVGLNIKIDSSFQKHLSVFLKDVDLQSLGDNFHERMLCGLG